ncbi:hypothetical protein [Aeromonas tecta]|uniref:hypothetical protein n=1 Tax=Aeromonas tecta TaxID=324617 RepID=UPI000681D0F2|nr:hypothetical protein [Aeromonas tecta]
MKKLIPLGLAAVFALTSGFTMAANTDVTTPAVTKAAPAPHAAKAAPAASTSSVKKAHKKHHHTEAAAKPVMKEAPKA